MVQLRPIPKQLLWVFAETTSSFLFRCGSLCLLSGEEALACQFKALGMWFWNLTAAEKYGPARLLSSPPDKTFLTHLLQAFETPL